ncbi:MAG TPA: aconitate hydratase, partial [Methylomirabilota bacterium]|nr:aconitate hydratase [Methylomirabilota bacterium]
MAVDQIKRLYDSMPAKLDEARRRFGRGLTLAEKILVAHADDFARQEWSRGKAQLRLRVDRVALQDATGQMALLQFMQAGK